MAQDQGERTSVVGIIGGGSKGSGRRSHLEIRMDILRSIHEGAEKPTQIMYKANLSWVGLQEHLQGLLQSALIRDVQYGNRRKYELTDKAIALMMTYRSMVQEMEGALRTPAPKF